MVNVKNTSWLYILSGLLITANIVTLTMLWLHKSDNGRPDDHAGRQNLFEYLSKELDFTKQQRDAYRLLRNDHHRGAQALQDSIRVAKDALFALLQQQNANESAVLAESNRSAAFSAQLDTFTFHHFQKVRQLCNAAQQQKFDAIIHEAMHMMAPQERGHPHNN